MILASQSPRRRELLAEAGFELTIAPADIDETRLPEEAPVDLVLRLAKQKAEAVRATLGDSPSDELLVAADTIVWMGDEALGKPADAHDAAAMLREPLRMHTPRLNGRLRHEALPEGTAIARTSFVETTDVTFWKLTEAEIAAYVDTGEPQDKAGAYGIQGAGRLLVKSIEGDYSNVVGLPIARLVRELAKLYEGEKDLVAEALRNGGAHA